MCVYVLTTVLKLMLRTWKIDPIRSNLGCTGMGDFYGTAAAVFFPRRHSGPDAGSIFGEGI